MALWLQCRRKSLRHALDSFFGIHRLGKMDGRAGSNGVAAGVFVVCERSQKHDGCFFQTGIGVDLGGNITAIQMRPQHIEENQMKVAVAGRVQGAGGIVFREHFVTRHSLEVQFETPGDIVNPTHGDSQSKEPRCDARLRPVRNPASETEPS